VNVKRCPELRSTDGDLAPLATHLAEKEWSGIGARLQVRCITAGVVVVAEVEEYFAEKFDWKFDGVEVNTLDSRSTSRCDSSYNVRFRDIVFRYI